MGYWDEVKEVFLKGVDKAVDGMKEGANIAVEKGKDGVAYTQLKKNLFLEHKKLHALIADLGSRTNDIYKEKKDLYSDPAISEIMGKIVQIEDECRRLEGEIKKIGT